MDSTSYRFNSTRLFESSELYIVRTKFIPQKSLCAVAIAEIEFYVLNQHELVAILMALQHL